MSDTPVTAPLQDSSFHYRRVPWIKEDTILVLILFVGAFFIFGWGTGTFGLLDPSDGYYSEGAREMVESKNWLVPHLNYAWFFDKPIMNYWLIACSYVTFGVNEMHSRFPAMLCASSVVASMYLFARQFFRRRAALFSALALLSSPMWLILSRMTLTDMPLACFIWIALGSFFVALERRNTAVAWVGYIALALGLLTKGPLALFLVAMNLGVYILLKRPSIQELWSLIIRLQVIPGLILTLAIAAPWYLLVNADTKGAFFQEFFLNQNINRAMGTVDHKAGPFYYVPILLGAAFPWTIILLVAARAWFTQWIRYIKESSFRTQSPALRCTAFGVTTAIATTLFFSALPTKLVTYFLPVVPALALVAGYTLDKLLRLKSARTLVAIVAFVITNIGCLCAFLIAYAMLGGSFSAIKGKVGLALAESLAGDIAPRAVLVAAFLIMYTGGLVSLLLIFLRKLKGASRSLVTAIVLSSIIAVPAALVLSWQQKCRSMQQIVVSVRNSNIDLVMLGHRTPSATFYRQKAIKYLPGPADLVTFLEEERATSTRSYFLVHQNVFADLNHAESVQLVERRGDWVLGRNK